MGCSGCGKRRKNAVRIKRPEPINVNQKTTKYSRTPGKLCPICRSPMRSIHKYDKSIKKVTRKWYCVKSSCPNSKG